MPEIIDEEFGTIVLRRSPKATAVKIRVAPNGTLRASLPLYTPLFVVKRLIRSSRPELRRLLADSFQGSSFHDGMQIGKSHTLLTRVGSHLNVKRHGLQLIVTLPDGLFIEDPSVSRLIRPVVIEALKQEAKHYLPKRLSYLATQLGYHYEKVRFSHASGRWGSCSSNGTISLNLALMKLPHELIDYVIIHELSHTIHMDHSEQFWDAVKLGDPLYRQHRRELREYSPSI